MDFFEYLSVMISIVLGLGMADLARTFGKLLSRETPVPRDPVTYAWYAWGFITIVLHWWLFWDLRTLGVDWTIRRFLFVLTGPTLLVLLVHILLPNSPETVENLRARYEAGRPRFFNILIALVLWNMAFAPVMLGRLSPNLVPQIGMLAMGIAGRLSSRRGVHVAIAVLMGIALGAGVLFGGATPS